MEWPSLSSPRTLRRTWLECSQHACAPLMQRHRESVRDTCSGLFSGHEADLPPLHTNLHHRRVHPAVRGEDLNAEERTKFTSCDNLCNICNLVSMAELSINTLRPMLVLMKMTHHFKTGPAFFQKGGCTSAPLNPAPAVHVL